MCVCVCACLFDFVHLPVSAGDRLFSVGLSCRPSVGLSSGLCVSACLRVSVCLCLCVCQRVHVCVLVSACFCVSVRLSLSVSLFVSLLCLWVGGERGECRAGLCVNIDNSASVKLQPRNSSQRTLHLMGSSQRIEQADPSDGTGVRLELDNMCRFWRQSILLNVTRR